MGGGWTTVTVRARPRLRYEPLPSGVYVWVCRGSNAVGMAYKRSVAFRYWREDCERQGFVVDLPHA